MKKTFVPLLLVLAMIATDANAWFFFFIPGSVVRGISDGITGARGNICVRDGLKVGETINSPAGNTATIKSLSGTSSICANPALPIRAELEFNFTFSSKAGINLTDEYETKPITDLQRFNGRLLTAASRSKSNKGIIISSRKREPNSDLAGIANAMEKAQVGALVDGKSGNAEQLIINGTNALRFEVAGKLKGIFGQQVTYVNTLIEGDSEILVVIAYAPTSSYDEDKSELKKVSEAISGIKSTSLPVTPPPAVESPTTTDAAVSSPKNDTGTDMNKNASDLITP